MRWHEYDSVLSIEMHKSVKKTNSDYLNEMFSVSDSHYDLRNQNVEFALISLEKHPWLTRF